MRIWTLVFLRLATGFGFWRMTRAATWHCGTWISLAIDTSAGTDAAIGWQTDRSWRRFDIWPPRLRRCWSLPPVKNPLLLNRSEVYTGVSSSCYDTFERPRYFGWFCISRRGRILTWHIVVLLKTGGVAISRAPWVIGLLVQVYLNSFSLFGNEGVVRFRR